MWRSFFFAVGIILILVGLQCLAVEQFRINKNNRLFAFANRANRALEATKSPDGLRNQNNFALQNGQAQNLANQQRFSLPSSESYYGGPSRFQSSAYPTTNSAYGGAGQLSQQSLSAKQVSNTLNYSDTGYGNNQRPKLLKSYPVTDWMPWGFLAAGTIISLYTNSTGHRHSGD